MASRVAALVAEVAALRSALEGKSQELIEAQTDVASMRIVESELRTKARC
jgi:hypothetical protein